ncbi:MAG: redoxin domain-containing protein [Faecousia sp.]
MTKQKRSFIRAVALFLLVCLCVSIVACSQQDIHETETTGKEKLTYTVTVKAQSGQPLTGISVMVYTDENQQELVWAAKTNDEGQISFSDVTCDGYVAVLNNVPDGYQVAQSYPITGENTEIVLSAVLEPIDDLTTVTYGLGDVMNDFSVTGPDGTEYTLSELLGEKKAVVLNFWYLECGPCRSEFPYLQEAYEQYSDQIEVLAMNPVNEDAEEVAAFRSNNGYTFPMMLCDKNWAQTMKLIGYPTTVVIDRYGTITLIHTGAITEAETFENIFAFFSSEEYEQSIIQNVAELPPAKEETGTATNPIEMGAQSSFTVTVDAGQTLYLSMYRVTNLYMYVNSPDAFIIYQNKTYKPSGSGVGVSLVSDDTFAPILVGIGNSGKQTQTFTVTMTSPRGSYSNPYSLELGQFDVKVPAGSDQGIHYLYTAQEDGVLTVQCLSATAGIPYDFILYNLTSYQYRNFGSEGKYNEEGRPTVSVRVRSGDRIRFIAAPLPDDTGSYPSANFTFLATLGDDSDLEPEVEKLTYAVTLTDEDRKPISGAQVNLIADGETTKLMTNADGIASAKLPVGTYTAVVTVPAGYEARNTVFRLTEAIPTISVKLDTVVVETATYIINVVDESGASVMGALVSLGDASGYTDEAGQISFTLTKGSYTVSVSAEGYAFASAEFADGADALTVTLTQGTVSGIDYSVYVVDYFGNPLTGVTVNFQKDGVGVDVKAVDSNGCAAIQLAPGNYTFTVGGYYFDASKAVLSESVPTVTITAVRRLGGEYINLQGYDLYYVDEGATYAPLNTTVVNGEDIVDNFFLFVPDRSGTYRFTTSDPNAVISYWATDRYIFNSVPEDYKDNSFTLNIKQDQIDNEVGYVVGVTGSSDCILVITRIGDAQITIDDLPWSTDWQTGVTPAQTYKVTGSGTLTYVDVTADSSAYNLVYNSRDRYYHLGSYSGPVVMVRLDKSAPYLSFQEVLENAGCKRYFFNEDGSFLKKEDYTEYLQACVQYKDATYGTYPLTKDLMYILQSYGEDAGWYDIDSGKFYLFGDTVVNEEIAWMFACCYLD